MIYPSKIDLNDFIGVTATSAGLEDVASLNKLESGIKNFQKMGYKIIETENVRECQKLVSSSGKKRAKEFLELWKDEKVKYIICARGGEFLMEMLPYMDKEEIKKATPKWVQGFSDTSLLLFYLTTNFNIATVHASNFSTYGMQILDESLIRSVEFVQKPDEILVQENFEKYETYSINREEGKELESFNLTEDVVYKNLYENKEETFEGRLIGGCIDVIKCIAGTKFDNTKNFCNQFNEGMIWYLENCEMSIADLYRSLWQMKNAGWFENAKAFLIGRTRANSPIGEFTYEDVLHSLFDDMNVKVIYDVDFGHVAPQWTMINGSFAKFHYKDGKGKMEIKLK